MALVLVLSACDQDFPPIPGIGSFQLAATNAELSDGTATIHITIVDEFGFASPVVVALADPPSGLTADPLTLPGGVLSGELVLHGQPGIFLDQQVVVTGAADGMVLKTPVWLSSGFDTGSLDASFGDHGVATVPSTSGCGGLAFQGAAGIVVGSYGGPSAPGSVTRLGPDGTLDATFGHAGIASLAGNAGGPHQMLVDTDGGILVAGDDTSTDQPLHGRLWRLDSDGAVDTSFGTGGFAEPVAEGRYQLSQNGGKTYLLGTRTAMSAFMARVVDDGSLDPQLGLSGLVRVLFFGEVAALADGSSWLIAGTTGVLADGSLRGRVAVLSLAGDEDPDRIDDGDALSAYSSPLSTATGTYVVNTQLDLTTGARRGVIQKLDADLMPDPSFAMAPDAESAIKPFAGQPDGKLLVLKSPGPGILDHIVRFNADGTSDPAVRIAVGKVGGGRVPVDAHVGCGPVVDAQGRLLLGYNLADGSIGLVRIQL